VAGSGGSVAAGAGFRQPARKRRFPGPSADGESPLSARRDAWKAKV